MTTSHIHRALVLGGSGFIGSHLCESLLDSGTSVICVDNFSTGNAVNIQSLLEVKGFQLVEHDITEPLPDIGMVDAIFHLASPASPADYHRLPIETLRAGSIGTERALEIASANNARFVLASTSEVYGDPQVHPQHETYFGNVNPVGPRSVYDEAKRYAEALTSAYRRSRSVNTAIARIFNTYGPRMRAEDGRMIPTFIAQSLAGDKLTVTGTGQQTRSICFVSDTVAGLIALARSNEPGPINIGNPVEASVAEWAVRVAAIAGSTAELDFIDAVEDDPRRRCPDISRARLRLGWEPLIGIDAGLRRTVDWFTHPTSPAPTSVG
ncbi:NAD-dependent epimerase/dehydratase family protein [Rhodococcus sovatensis]|uniref:NAD-dependent epimerase/dehydratase family protein n=1 Tax=Rhodococcus sovatensis TaxID=1805840 RepID=A0ABZ2PNT0_9NOCA